MRFGSALALIWACGFAFSLVLAAVELPVLALIPLGLCVLVHSALNAHHSVLFLVAAIPASHLLPALPDVLSAAKLVGVVCLVCSLPVILQRVEKGPNDALTLLALALPAWALVLVPFSTDPGFAFRTWSTVALVWAMPFLFCVHLRSYRDLERALWVLLLICVPLAVYVLGIEFEAGTAAATRHHRIQIFSFVQDRRAELNEVARTLVVGAYACFALALSNRKWRGVLLVSLIILVLAVIVTKARSCYIFGPAALILASLLPSRRSRMKRSNVFVLVLIVAIIAVYVGASSGLLGPGVGDRFASIFDKNDSSRGRLVLWKLYLEDAASRFFLGAGPGGARWSIPFKSDSGMPMVSHNDVIEILGDLGLAGCLVFVCVHALIGRRLLTMPNSPARMFVAATWIFLLLGGMTQVDFYRKYYGIALALVIVGVSLDRRRERWLGPNPEARSTSPQKS